MAAVMKDPKVLSVLEKKRADKGFRELQGENLRSMFFELITKEVRISISFISNNIGISIRILFKQDLVLSTDYLLNLVLLKSTSVSNGRFCY